MIRLERTSRRGDETITDVQYAITSLSPQRADAGKLLEIWRSHWGIENRLHWVRDVHWQEDRCRVRHHRGSYNLACFRNAAINLLRLAKAPSLIGAIRENAYRVDRLFAKLGIKKL